METKEEEVIQYRFNCETCRYHTNIKGSYDKHMESVLHLTGKRKIRKDRKQAMYFCDNCDFKTTHEVNFKAHCLNNHATIDKKKSNFKYYCIKCNFGTFVEPAFDRHTKTKKHKIKTI